MNNNNENIHFPIKNYIYITNVYIKKIKIRENITDITLINNELVIFPDLPSKVVYLTIRKNNIHKIPANLPINIEYMKMDNNKIKKLPDTLPPFLEFLDISSNLLKKLPDTLPCYLKILDVRDNPDLNYIPNYNLQYLKIYTDLEYNEETGIYGIPKNKMKKNDLKNSNIINDNK